VCGTIWCGIGRVSVCCVWDSLGRVGGTDFMLCMGLFGAFLRERIFAVCGRD